MEQVDRLVYWTIETTKHVPVKCIRGDIFVLVVDRVSRCNSNDYVVATDNQTDAVGPKNERD